jgi:hypothetical protein
MQVCAPVAGSAEPLAKSASSSSNSALKPTFAVLSCIDCQMKPSTPSLAFACFNSVVIIAAENYGVGRAISYIENLFPIASRAK